MSTSRRSYGARASRFQSILMPVADAEALVEPFRQAGDWSRAHGIPAHITVAGPWSPSVALPAGALRELAAAMQGRRFTLGVIGRLGEAICLFPQDDRELLRLRAGILETVGVADAIDDGWRLHLTVCRGPGAEGAGAVKETLSKALPIRCEVRGLLLAQLLGDCEVTVRPL